AREHRLGMVHAIDVALFEPDAVVIGPDQHGAERMMARVERAPGDRIGGAQVARDLRGARFAGAAAHGVCPGHDDGDVESFSITLRTVCSYSACCSLSRPLCEPFSNGTQRVPGGAASNSPRPSAIGTVLSAVPCIIRIGASILPILSTESNCCVAN